MTERLLLRPFTPEDADDVRRLAGDREIADTTLNIPHPYGEGMALEWIASHGKGFETGENLTFAMTLRVTGELVGAVSLMVRKEHARAELGYWTGRPYWGRGYCTEASREVIRYGFDEMGLNRIFATHFTRNPASGEVMKKLGMRFEGVQREHVRKTSSFEDLAVYAILRSDWSGG